MRKVLFLFSFFLLTPILITISILYLHFLYYTQKSQNGFLSGNLGTGVAFAALPSAENVFSDNIVAKDARTEIVRQFFERYKSPLEPFAQNIVENADKNGLDYRLLPAIAMQESNLCKKIILDSYNCWGFGIYGKKVTRFSNYEEAIDTVSKTLAKHYTGIGLNTPEEIMRKYTPSSNGSWAYSVNYFMNELQ